MRFRHLTPCLPLIVALYSAAQGAAELQYNRDIRPILADHCFRCHGPDTAQRQAGLRLDVRDSALAAADSGSVPIVPGEPEASELVRRIMSEDPSEQMPPPDAPQSLTSEQREKLRAWIAAGAVYQPHWAYLPRERPPLPAVKNAAWPQNAVDYFVLARLESEGLEPSQAAAPATLLRRLALDLTGLPPTPVEIEQFEAELAAIGALHGHADGNGEFTWTSAAQRVYESWVERYLSSPHYGERMAVDWLDAARFADSNGYQVDRDREMYAWRDWVIQAFNDNKPFDEFTVEQLAGDLLPNPTLEQRIATGFHRNHMLNEEGGIIPEEFLAEYCADRVETTATVWLGQTFNCTRCHDHKFDPFTQQDFYSLYAFFHNIAESGIGNYGAPIRRNSPPMLKLTAPDIEAKLASLQAERAAVDEKRKTLEAELKAAGADIEQNADRKALADQVAALDKQIDETDLKIPRTLVMEELPEPRPTFILIRGAYDKKGEQVTARTPASLPPMAAEWPANRLGLARWLIDPANPLPARVTVNRFWQSVFGTGLVSTAGDFGTQGELPSHPELLDWLADEFIRSGWDIKAMMRLLVTSAAYRQSSSSSPELLARDPDNRLLARGPRLRLQAEFLRDQALAASGLLVGACGGPSVRPYHPPGLYEQVVAGSSASTYVLGQGAELYRRSLYTYWKRSVPNPAMLVFDAPFREICTVRRPRTNTPLQALNLMNDPTYVEASRCLAERVLRGSAPAEKAASGEAGSMEQRIEQAFRLVLVRRPRAAELAVLCRAYERALADFQQDQAAAAALLDVGELPVPADLDVPQFAALTVVASTLLNLDEAITKE